MANGDSYERELGGINATLGSIETTLSGLGSELKESREESGQWRQRFREQLDRHAARTDDALDKLAVRTTALEVDLSNHKAEMEKSRRLIWRVLLGGGGGGATIFAAWNQAKAAITHIFK